MSGWKKIEVGATRVRYRHDGEEHAHFGSGYEVEHAVDGVATDYRPVRNWNSRDWFVLGLLAGRRETVGEQVEIGL